MRNKIRLYIGDRQADLDDGSFILLNYTAEDLTNPTIVRNSFSRQITLKGTPTNNEIFGGIYRNDRLTQYGGVIGIDFDPTRKTPFTIYNEMGEILEEGYLKLNKVVRSGRNISYKVTLYGGLGSFLYGLSYDTDGKQLSLADLDYGETLDFTINAATILEAWERLGHGTGPTKWDVINFMPAYLGLPPSPFDANKCVVHAVTAGLKYRDEDYRTDPNGYTLVTLNDKVTANEAKDFRSYLQKPVISMAAIINAICNPSNNGGYTVNLDPEFFDALNPYWYATWLTLPMFDDLNIDVTETTNTQTMTDLATELPIIGGGSGMVSVTVQAEPDADMTGLPNDDFKLWFQNAMGRAVNYLVFTLTLYDSSHNVLTTATYRITTSGITVNSQYPQPDFLFDHINAAGEFVDADGNPVTFHLFAEADGAAYYKVEISGESYVWGATGFNPGDVSWRMWRTGESVVGTNYPFDPHLDTAQVDVTSLSSSTVRTGATITKAGLLSGSKTPADYLLSFCKTFGLQLSRRKGEKTIDVTLRKNFYTGTVTDLAGRIDHGQDIEKTPFAFDAKWYLFGNDAKGEYADWYKANYLRPFGQFRVNTGYDFDASQKSMTDGIVFGNAVSVLETSKFFCSLVLGTKNIPAVFLSGGKYTLYNGSETKQLDLPYAAAAVKTWTNPSHPMHDAWEKVQFHGPQNAHIDERDTLVFFSRMEDTTGMHLSLTDDTEEMLALNGNTPCWLPNYCDLVPSALLSEMPHFSRYTWSGTTINFQLDWGDPQELQIPGVSLGVKSNIFSQYWEKYIGDRYDDDSAVVTAYVDLRGMQVGEEMLRTFYAFDGAVWALNRIVDHSLTTFGATLCEFVKVQDITNYTTY